MKMIKFVMSKGEPIIVSLEKGEAILNSPEQIIKITDEKGVWNGKTINKSYIISTDVDYDATRDANKELKYEETRLMIEGAQQYDRENKVMSTKELFAKHRPKFMREMDEKRKTNPSAHY